MFNNRFGYSRLTTAIRIAVLPLSLVATDVLARDVHGNEEITAATPNDFYIIKPGAHLTANGATMVYAEARDAAFTMNGGRVVASNQIGVALYNTQATISNADISSSGSTGLVAGFSGTSGSVVVVNNSTISGATQGVSLSALSDLTLNGTQVEGGNFGLFALGGQLTTHASSIKGGNVGILVARDGLNQGAVLNLDQTEVIGEAGAAIVVAVPVTAQINISNGTTLVGGNGNMLELTGGGSADVTVNNSNLTGNIQVGTGSALDLNLDFASMTGDIINSGGTANVGLNNGAVLTGRLENVDKLAVNSDATWILVNGQDELKELSMNGGNVKFGDSDAFHQLNVTNLSGTGGTFIMKADFSTLTGDFLNVTGTSSGAHQLLISSTGADPLSDDRLHVVHTADGGASFSLVGDRVDAGTYSYGLISDNRNADWYLDPDSKVISPSTNSVLALFNAAPSVLLGEMANLRTRMGELRFNDGKSAGLWSRAYGNKYEVSNDQTGLGYNQSQRGFTLGADAPLEAGDGQWLIGAMAGHSTSDLDLNRGSKAEIKSYFVGGYATWLDTESGFYFDGVLKLNRLHSESDVAMSDGKKAKGNYTQNAVGASAEVGRHIKLDDGYFVEPYGKLDAVITQAQSYTLDNGLQAKGDRSSSVIGELGMTAGRNFQLESGSVLQPYLKAAVAHEFDQSNKVFVNGNEFNNDLSGSRLKLGAGVAMSVSQNLNLQAELEHSTGKNIKQPLGVNVGVRWAF